MRFIKQDTVSVEDLADARGQFDIAFVGRDDLDDRSAFSVEKSTALALRTAPVHYDPVTFELHVADQIYRLDNLEDLPLAFPASRIVMDATTLEFPEIALILKAYGRLVMPPPRCVFIYTEPLEYVRRPAQEAAPPGSAFDLTLGFRARNAIPSFTPMLSEKTRAHLVAFLGFEGARLSRVINEDDGHFYKEVTVAFGIPPFQAAFDMHALMANTRLIEQCSPNVRFSAANNPRAAYKLLQEVHRGLRGSVCNRIAVAPFGTKPAAIGSALYCIGQDTMRVVYDHPERKKGRTRGVHRTHWYEVQLGT